MRWRVRIQMPWQRLSRLSPEILVFKDARMVSWMQFLGVVRKSSFKEACLEI